MDPNPVAAHGFGRGTAAGAVIALALALAMPAPATAAAVPELPRKTLDTAGVESTGRTIAVGAGGDLKGALARAEPGDVITLQPGSVYEGPFELPRKEGEGWIVIRSADPERALPPPGTRVGPEHEAAMPVLESGSRTVISAAPGASHYRFVGIHIRPKRGVFLHNLVLLGHDETDVGELAHHIIFDRCLLRGDPEAGTRRGIAMNSAYTAVIDSHLSGFKEVGADSQAIMGWNGPGPFKIVNNYLEGAGENVMFGGETAAIEGLVPSDIEIRGNHLAKPLRWKVDHPEYEGTPWTVKNLLELKNARRVLVDGNLLEYSWHHAQIGFAVLFTVRSERGAMPWAVVEDVTFTNNVVRHAGHGISLLGRDNHGGLLQRILIENNVFEDIGGDWGGGRLFQFVDGTRDVVIRDNIAGQSGSIVVASGEPHEGFVFTGNIVPHNQYGIDGDSTLPGTATLARHFPGAVVSGNTIAGANPSAYPPGNRFPRAHPGIDHTVVCGAWPERWRFQCLHG